MYLNKKMMFFSEEPDGDYLEVIETQKPKCDEYESVKAIYTEKEGKYLQTWEIFRDESKISFAIKALEKELSDTDYIIIKQQESSIIGDELPYTLEQMIEIANLRAAKRKRINELEKKINER